jgi:hypothetical protein
MYRTPVLLLGVAAIFLIALGRPGLCRMVTEDIGLFAAFGTAVVPYPF